MDTISQESNGSPSYLPVAALIIGLLAGVFAGVALLKVSAINRQLEAQAAVSSRVDALESQVRTAVTSSEGASQRISKVITDTNSAFTKFGEVISNMQADLQKAQESRPAPSTTAGAAPKGAGAAAAPTAGPGEYVVKSGDTGTRIASANGTTIQALTDANPGINWSRLQVGQKIKLPPR
jgi:LysM repeat protein